MIKSIYLTVLHLVLVISIVIGVSQCSKATRISKELSDKEEIFNKANEVVKIAFDNDSNMIVNTKPEEQLLSTAASSVNNLLDSVSDVLKLPSNERIIYYNRIPIESSIELKATNVNSEFAETENENWYMSYNFRDSVFKGRYKTIYQSAVTKKDYSLLGIQYKPETNRQYDWFQDKEILDIKPTSVVIKDDTKPKYKFQAHSVSKFRSLNNSLLSGAELEVGVNRVTIGGQYLYNFNTNSPEYEISFKYGIFKP